MRNSFACDILAQGCIPVGLLAILHALLEGIEMRQMRKRRFLINAEINQTGDLVTALVEQGAHGLGVVEGQGQGVFCEFRWHAGRTRDAGPHVGHRARCQLDPARSEPRGHAHVERAVDVAATQRRQEPGTGERREGDRGHKGRKRRENPVTDLLGDIFDF